MKRFVSLILCLTLFIGIVPTNSLAARSFTHEQSLASNLKTLGIFQGVSLTDFALERAPTRIEAIVMLIRLLGKEQVALSGLWSHPFTDVPSWANQYVGYAYTEGLANGVALDRFGTGNASSAMYLTFVLRALGYSDMGGADFVWDDPYSLASQAGILPSGVDRQNFLRADVVLVSYAALPAFLKNSNQTLADKLISEHVFTREAYDACFNPQNSTETNTPVTQTPVTQTPSTKPAETVNSLTAEEIYAKCSPAVFYIEMFDERNHPFGSGSGFFIESSGVAVTNYHVIEDASYAKITLSTTGKTYDVTGVYAFSKQDDWAIIQVNGSNFPTLEIGENWTITGGATVYAIGSPEGLQNTISEGLISNTERVLDGTTYIQISAPISHGSSGGALINSFGEVIGITSAVLNEGQNLNFAIPIYALGAYNKSTLTKLSKVGTVADDAYNTGDVRIAAYSYLRSWIQAAKNDNIDGNAAYTEIIDTDDSSDLTYSIMYDKSEEEIVLFCSYSPTGSAYNHTSMISLTPYDSESFYYYSYSIPNFKTYATGYGYIIPSTISEDSYFNFPTFEGERYDLEECLQGAHATCIAALEFANYIYDSYLKKHGNFSVADFGFTGIY